MPFDCCFFLKKIVISQAKKCICYRYRTDALDFAVLLDGLAGSVERPFIKAVKQKKQKSIHRYVRLAKKANMLGTGSCFHVTTMLLQKSKNYQEIHTLLQSKFSIHCYFMDTVFIFGSGFGQSRMVCTMYILHMC